jgi:hypothetical protein
MDSGILRGGICILRVAARGRDFGRKLIASLLLPPTCQGKRNTKNLAHVYTSGSSMSTASQ